MSENYATLSAENMWVDLAPSIRKCWEAAAIYALVRLAPHPADPRVEALAQAISQLTGRPWALVPGPIRDEFRAAARAALAAVEADPNA